MNCPLYQQTGKHKSTKTLIPFAFSFLERFFTSSFFPCWKFVADIIRFYQFLFSPCILCAYSLSHVWLFATSTLLFGGLYPSRILSPWGFSRQKYWSGLPCPLPEDLLNPEIKPRSATMYMDSFAVWAKGKPRQNKGITPNINEL